MAERADPECSGFKVGSQYRDNFIDRYTWANNYIYGIVLDIPTGMGWGTSLLTNADRIIGIDRDKEAIDKAISLYSSSHITFLRGLMQDIPIKDNSIDSIVCLEGYEHICRDDQFILINELFRVIKSKGTIVMSIPVSDRTGKQSGNEFHLHEPTMIEVDESIKDKFIIQERTVVNDNAKYRMCPRW